jgi:hypothetical protein
MKVLKQEMAGELVAGMLASPQSNPLLLSQTSGSGLTARTFRGSFLGVARTTPAARA